MTKICDSVLRAKVEEAYQFSVEKGGTFNRGAAAGYIKLLGMTFDRQELGKVVKEVAEEHGIVSMRDTFKSRVYRELGERIRDEKDLVAFMIENDIEPVESELKKYRGIVDVVERLIAKYEA